MTTERAPILCFGEVLWDSLPRGLFPGGAPLNVAFHLRQLGARPIVVSAVGRDRLGEELLRRFAAWGLDTRGVNVHSRRRTGMARVALSGADSRFDIERDVAWDRIEPTQEIRAHVEGAAAVVFGTLAQRSAHNRAKLATLIERCAHGWKVLDVNLRPPHDSVGLAWELVRRADLVKLNGDELGLLLGHKVAPEPRRLEAAARRFAARAGAPSASRAVCVTAGAVGAGLLIGDEWWWRAARPVRVVDTVGAGDSLLAALLFFLLSGRPPSTTLRMAVRLSEYVVGQDGAMPAHPRPR
jgi:fructokinase